ncbi:MAG: acyl-ACP--UDP-N-acetylglucosamine O-acyltransferase [Myxococcales bacterium]|nr:MAG: acyl-ACP--UDP-N-acetylglucosamine O-acyltransferase [Myxococcales bacterium]
MARIHSSAVVDPGAKLADDVEIGPYCVIGGEVELGRGVSVGPHAVIVGRTSIGPRTRIFPFTVIGEAPQLLEADPGTRLLIGADNVIREFCSIHAGSGAGGDATRLGDGNFLLNNVHVAHDCRIGDRCVLASLSAFAGHVVIEDHAVIGAMVGVHQFVRIGEHSFTGAATRLSKDVPPFSRVAGQRAHWIGVNAVGLRRRSFAPEKIDELRRAFRVLFRSKLRLAAAIDRVALEHAGTPEVERLLHFLATSRRGITR